MRKKEIVGHGQARLHIWPQLPTTKVIKQTVKKRAILVTLQMSQRTFEQVLRLLGLSRGRTILNIVFIERFSGSATSSF